MIRCKEGEGPIFGWGVTGASTVMEMKCVTCNHWIWCVLHPFKAPQKGGKLDLDEVSIVFVMPPPPRKKHTDLHES